VAIIDIVDLSYSYPHTQQPALRNVSLSIEEGTFVALMGANGAGKSTLCYTITGFVPHFFQGEFQGSATIAGKDLKSSELVDIVTLASLVFQKPQNQISGTKFTVFDEVAFGLENLGVPRDEMIKRIERALELTGISHLAERSPYALSGGQQQRLAFASMLAMDSPILVLDEPTSQLDPIGSREVFEVVEKLTDEGKTVIMAEHKLEWIAAFADRVIVLDEGGVLLDGPPDQVLTSPLLVENDIGSTRYTAVARAAQEQGLVSAQNELPVSLEQAERFFKQAQEK
jgi:energy-coupling factor transport system ATP-binding protein